MLPVLSRPRYEKEIWSSEQSDGGLFSYMMAERTEIIDLTCSIGQGFFRCLHISTCHPVTAKGNGVLCTHRDAANAGYTDWRVSAKPDRVTNDDPGKWIGSVAGPSGKVLEQGNDRNNKPPLCCVGSSCGFVLHQVMLPGSTSRIQPCTRGLGP